MFQLSGDRCDPEHGRAKNWLAINTCPAGRSVTPLVRSGGESDSMRTAARLTGSERTVGHPLLQDWSIG